MSEKKQDDSSFGVAIFAILVAVFAFGMSAIAARTAPPKPCDCKPSPTPAPCCKVDDCRQELALVDTRFGDVWDELVEVQEQLAKLKPCGCGPVKECCCDLSEVCKCEPSKPCACSDKPACECKPQQIIKLPVHRVLKRCK